MRPLLLCLTALALSVPLAVRAAPAPASAAAPAAGDFDAKAKALLQTAEAAGEAGRWDDMAKALGAARDLYAKNAGEDDRRALHVDVMMVEALHRAGRDEDAIAEGMAPLRRFGRQMSGTPSLDELNLRYTLAMAFTACRAARCGNEDNRLKNVDFLMQSLMQGLSAYPKADPRVAELRANFAQACPQRYEPADCAAALGN